MFRCLGCRTRRKTWPKMQEHVQKSGCQLCHCTGYHYAHRPGSRFCHQNPTSIMWAEWNRGAEIEVIEQIAQYVVENNPGQQSRIELAIVEMFGGNHV